LPTLPLLFLVAAAKSFFFPSPTRDRTSGLPLSRRLSPSFPGPPPRRQDNLKRSVFTKTAGRPFPCQHRWPPSPWIRSPFRRSPGLLLRHPIRTTLFFPRTGPEILPGAGAILLNNVPFDRRGIYILFSIPGPKNQRSSFSTKASFFPFPRISAPNPLSTCTYPSLPRAAFLPFSDQNRSDMSSLPRNPAFSQRQQNAPSFLLFSPLSADQPPCGRWESQPFPPCEPEVRRVSFLECIRSPLPFVAHRRARFFFFFLSSQFPRANSLRARWPFSLKDKDPLQVSFQICSKPHTVIAPRRRKRSHARGGAF